MAQYSSSQSLRDDLVDALPKDVRLKIRHVSTPPTPCPALFSAPPGQQEETTYCESHFLVVTAAESELEGKEVITFAVEVLIYTTEKLTTLFVSKADSTGHLPLSQKNRGSPSVIRLVSTAFLSHLVRTRQRENARLVLSLFARSQNQYLFPGSIENSTKHVLDDRELVKWWCRVVDPILRIYEVENPPLEPDDLKTTATGYLIAPGCDKYETRLFFPPTARSDPADSVRWHSSHPLYQIAPNPRAPPRCLVPHFPDDPKARFLDALDDEIIDIAPKESPTKRGSNGQWRTVKSLEQFWEMMAFRQECAAGRLVGFLWVVFTPPDLDDGLEDELDERMRPKSHLLTPTQSQSQNPLLSASVPTLAPSSPTLAPMSPKSSPLQPHVDKADLPITSASQPDGSENKEIRTNGNFASTDDQTIDPTTDSTVLEVSEKTKYFIWPKSSRGEILLEESDYERVNELLQELDFAGLDLAAESTQRWIKEVQTTAKKESWGQDIVGRKVFQQTPVGQTGGVNLIGAGLVRKRKKADMDTEAPSESKDGAPDHVQRSGGGAPNGVNVLGVGIVRKKAKA